MIDSARVYAGSERTYHQQLLSTNPIQETYSPAVVIHCTFHIEAYANVGHDRLSLTFRQPGLFIPSLLYELNLIIFKVDPNLILLKVEL